LLVSAIAVNLIFLIYFKYANFFVDNLNQLTGSAWTFAQVVLPLGISFFTFTQIAFLVDTYQGKVKEFNFVHYALFVTYFPHLIAGPVLHHAEMMPQFAKRTVCRIHWDNVAVGLSIFVLGLAKKVLLADSVADFSTPVFEAVKAGGEPMLIEAWVGALAYTLQLYFDFSAYSDMAIGLSLMFNVRLPLNFNSPYKATSIIEFWRCWHMTLSRFLRDYLYIPLGGSRLGAPRRYANLVITMLLGGLWHGAGWTFVIWGALHGFYLLVNHAWRGLKARMGWSDGGRLAALGAGALTFLAVVAGWVFFRADSFSTAVTMLQGMAGMNGVSLPGSLEERLGSLLGSHPWLIFEGMNPLVGFKWIDGSMIFGLSFVVVWLLPNVHEMFQRYRPVCEDGEVAGPHQASSVYSIKPSLIGEKQHVLQWQPLLKYAWGIGALFAVLIINLTKVSEFLYFQF
jgi:D-alanyl-lipoteichoic acid acyltransferase DltB (MBOAT superfamily)